jgi:hypothetical protein
LDLRAGGLRPPFAGDGGYGDAAEFRHGLTGRGLSYLVQVSIRAGVYPHDLHYQAGGKYSEPRYREPATAVKDPVLAGVPAQTQPVAWRYGSGRRADTPITMRSRFVFTPVPPAGRTLLTARRGRDLPEAWLDRRIATRAERAHQVVAVEPVRQHGETQPHPMRETALAHPGAAFVVVEAEAGCQFAVVVLARLAPHITLVSAAQPSAPGNACSAQKQQCRPEPLRSPP